MFEWLRDLIVTFLLAFVGVNVELHGAPGPQAAPLPAAVEQSVPAKAAPASESSEIQSAPEPTSVQDRAITFRLHISTRALKLGQRG